MKPENFDTMARVVPNFWKDKDKVVPVLLLSGEVKL
jgi:hypothetical protein